MKKQTYKVEVSIEETIRSNQTLEVEATSPEEAERICEEDRDAWRNHECSDRVRIIEPEDAADIDTVSVEYSVEQKEPERRPSTRVDPETKVRLRAEKKLAVLQKALANESFLLSGECIHLDTGKHVHLPADLCRLLNEYLAGRGSCPFLVKRLSAFARCIWNRLYQCVAEFEDSDDPLLKLVVEDGTPDGGEHDDA